MDNDAVDRGAVDNWSGGGGDRGRGEPRCKQRASGTCKRAPRIAEYNPRTRHVPPPKRCAPATTHQQQRRRNHHPRQQRHTTKLICDRFRGRG